MKGVCIDNCSKSRKLGGKYYYYLRRVFQLRTGSKLRKVFESRARDSVFRSSMTNRALSIPSNVLFPFLFSARNRSSFNEVKIRGRYWTVVC